MGVTGRLLGSAQALVDTFRNPALRRLQLASAGSILGSFAYFVALAVYAFRHGGAGAVALVSVLQMLPAAVSAPFLATLADRLPRRLVMISADLVRAVLMVAAAVSIALGGPAWIVYAVVTLVQIASTAFGPAKAALLPILARTPGELTAANVAGRTLEGGGGFIGPAIGGFLLAATNEQTVFALNAASFIWSAVLVFGLRVDSAVAAHASEPEEEGEEAHEEGVGHHLTAGFRAIRESKDLGMLLTLYAVQTLVAGAIEVLVVVTALDLLHGGPKEVGLFDAAIGVGVLFGSLVALALAARGRLAADFGLGLFLFGALVIVGAAPHLAPAIAALGVLGVGNAIVDVAAVTLLQRTVSNEVLGRVLGILEGILLGALGLGALAAPLLIHVLGVRTTLIAVGAVLPALTMVAWPRLQRLDAPEPASVELLRGVEILAPLGLSTLDRLARSLVEVRLPAATEIVRQGEPGDRFYIIEAGEAEVAFDDGTKVLGPGASFGEIALLRDVPRTATVTARTDVLLRALERGDFLAAVTGDAASATAADALIARRLGDLRADLTTEP